MGVNLFLLIQNSIEYDSDWEPINDFNQGYDAESRTQSHKTSKCSWNMNAQWITINIFETILFWITYLSNPKYQKVCLVHTYYLPNYQNRNEQLKLILQCLSLLPWSSIYILFEIASWKKDLDSAYIELEQPYIWIPIMFQC